MKIYKPTIYNNEKFTELHCTIESEFLPEGKIEIFFRTEKNWGRYFVHETCDTFLLASILPAMRHGESIYLDCEVSERLLYNVRTSLLHLIHLSYGYKTIEVISARGTVQTKYEGKGVGCGCSLGVDSLAAIFSHLGLKDTPDYNITHLTYFNVGSHGYKDEEANNKSYHHDMIKVDEFAKNLGIPVVKIESNVWKLFTGFNFDQSGNFINMSTVLSMQKLFGTYLYGSNYPMQAFDFTNRCSGYFETVMLPMSSTESTQLIVANADMTRFEKTDFIVKFPDTYKYLYVCWKELIVNNDPNHPIAAIKDNYLNCTRCDKCLRTCVHLDMMGILDKFSEIFDLKYYQQIKKNYLAKVLNDKKNAFNSEILRMAKEKNFKIPMSSKLIALGQRLHISGVLNRFKRISK